MKRFLLIDDHVVVRSGIKMLLSDIYAEAQIEEAYDGNTALEKVREHFYDLVILDIQMPNTDAFALMEKFRSEFSSLKVLVFSMNPESIYALRFIKAGAMGFISKDAPLDEIKKAIDRVLHDKKYISDEMLSVIAEGRESSEEKNPFSLLSAREFEIVSMLLSGKTISGIAAELSLGISTIGTHKGRIFNKLKVTNLLELSDLANLYHFNK